jgi:glutathione S-transferase
MVQPLLIIGSYLSPYVRKALVLLELKAVAYEVDPIVPFYGNDEFARLSPLRQIPVLVDGDLVLNDSSVICQYIEDRHPQPSLYPADVADRARARWLEEFADTRLGDVLVWRLFYQKGVRRYVFGEETDVAMVDHALEHEIPSALDYLETQLPADGFLFGSLSIADIAITCFFRNAAFVRYTIDAQRWPRTAAFVARVQALPAFRKLATFEERSLRVPVPQQRDVLIELGAPVSSESLSAPTPRKGIRRIA